jgi:hypothetical protein
MREVKAGAIYFLIVFAIGWLLGPIRQLWVVPRFGQLTGLLLEAPLMLLAMIISAQWILRRLEIPYAFGRRLTIGVIALAILAVAELAGVVWLRGIAPGEYLAGLATVPGSISVLLFLLFAAMPMLVRRHDRRL